MSENAVLNEIKVCVIYASVRHGKLAVLCANWYKRKALFVKTAELLSVICKERKSA